MTATVMLFIGGAAAGVILGGRIGDHALIPAAVACVALAVANVLHDRRRRASDAGNESVAILTPLTPLADFKPY
nr:hypothetical protein [Mycobacterium paragordonae]